MEERRRGGVVDAHGERRLARVAESAGDRKRRADRAVRGVCQPGGQRAGQGAGQPACKQGRVHAADHRDAEGAAEQPRGVIHRRAHARLRPWDDVHDRLGRRRAGESHPGAEENHLRRDRSVARGCRAGRDPGVEAGHGDQAGGDDELGAEAHRKPGAEHRGYADRGRHRQQVNASGQRAVALEELEVLGDQEDEAEEAEEGDCHRAAGRGEAGVTEETDVEHRRRGTPLPHHEGGEKDGGDREAAERAGAAPAVVGRLDDREDQQPHRRR